MIILSKSQWRNVNGNKSYQQVLGFFLQTLLLWNPLFSVGRRGSCSVFTSCISEPTFVSSSLDPSHKKLYFFFSEVGKEFSFVDELRTARVAQVCKVTVNTEKLLKQNVTMKYNYWSLLSASQDDVGGQRTLQKKWTSFAKAPLLCQSPKQLPFNVLQDMFTLQPPEGSDTSETLFYGVFTSQW